MPLRRLYVFLQRDVRLLELELQRFGLPLLNAPLHRLCVFLRRDAILLFAALLLNVILQLLP